MGKTTAPNANSEHGSRHEKNDPNILCMRIPAVEALREEKTTPIFVRGCTHNRKDANLQFVGAQQLVGERKKTCVRPKTPPKPVREEPMDPKLW